MEGGFRVFELRDYDVDGCEDGVGHDDGIYDEAGHEHFLGSGGRQFGTALQGSGGALTLEADYPSRG